MAVNPDKLNAFMGKAVGDIGAAMSCVPASLAYNGPALGAQTGEARLRDVVMKGGRTRFRRAPQMPFNLVLEARP